MTERMKLKESNCPSCGKTLNAATVLGDDDTRPNPGEFTVCMYCGHIMAFADDLTVRELTADEMIEAAAHPGILEIQKARADLPPKEKIHTKDMLAAALKEVLLNSMAEKAAEGYYHDFLSPLPLPEIQLVNDLEKAAKIHPKRKEAIMALRSRVINGDFDANKEESDAWAASPEGQQAYRDLLRK